MNGRNFLTLTIHHSPLFMKQCPVCKTTYPDETLKFCLADGTGLLPVRDDQETIQMSADRNPLRIDFQNDSAQTHFTPTAAPVQTTKKGCSPLLVGGSLVLLFLAFGAIAAAIYFFVPFGAKNTADSIANTDQNSAPPTTKSNANSDEINAKIANLEKQLQAQKNQKQPANVQPSPTRTVQLPTTNYETKTATVAPTGDGFLSLRTEPSTKTGVQLVKIPTGANVTLTGKCQNYGKTADGKTGSWCLVSYNNQTGWVFDAYLIK